MSVTVQIWIKIYVLSLPHLAATNREQVLFKANSPCPALQIAIVFMIEPLWTSLISAIL